MSDSGKGVSRRRLLTAGGATLAGSLFFGRLPAFGQGAGESLPAQRVDPVARAAAPLKPLGNHGLLVRQGGSKPVYLAPQGNSDPAVLSHADNLFWSDVMMEHSRFIALFLAGPELANLRAQALQFEGMFAGQLAKLQVDGASGAYKKLNAESIDLAKALVDFKHMLHDQARGGKIRPLAFPSFFAHTAQEGERFITRLGLLSQGQPQLDRSEVIGFWSEVIADHLKSTAHLLDPTEVALIETTRKSTARFERFAEERPDSTDAVIAAVEETIDLTATTEKGLDAGTIQGIITPALADHHRREAIKAADELRRVSFVHASR